jgi:hypothetical protein
VLRNLMAMHVTLLFQCELYKTIVGRFIDRIMLPKQRCIVQALSKVVGIMPDSVTAAMLSQHGGLQRQEEILARTEHLLAEYEARVSGVQGTHGGKQFCVQMQGVPSLFVDGTNALIASNARVTASQQRIHSMKAITSKDKDVLVESGAAVATGKDGNMPKIEDPSQDQSVQPPEITNSQLHFLQCLHNSQDALPDCAVGASQENLFHFINSQPAAGGSDPLMATPFSQSTFAIPGSDPGGPTTSQLLAGHPSSMAPAGEIEGAQ